MNTSRQEAAALATGVVATVPSNIEAALCPPFPWLTDVQLALAGSSVKLGAQNCWSESSGAFTGEVSPQMLAEMCEYVIVGHSERRRIIGETDQVVAAKLRTALSTGLQVIICVGEDLESRQSGGAVLLVQEQLASTLDGLDEDQVSRCVVAYEPIWAIGTGV